MVNILYLPICVPENVDFLDSLREAIFVHLDRNEPLGEGAPLNKMRSFRNESVEFLLKYSAEDMPLNELLLKNGIENLLKYTCNVNFLVTNIPNLSRLEGIRFNWHFRYSETDVRRFVGNDLRFELCSCFYDLAAVFLKTALNIVDSSNDKFGISSMIQNASNNHGLLIPLSSNISILRKAFSLLQFSESIFSFMIQQKYQMDNFEHLHIQTITIYRNFVLVYMFIFNARINELNNDKNFLEGYKYVIALISKTLHIVVSSIKLLPGFAFLSTLKVFFENLLQYFYMKFLVATAKTMEPCNDCGKIIGCLMLAQKHVETILKKFQKNKNLCSVYLNEKKEINSFLETMNTENSFIYHKVVVNFSDSDFSDLVELNIENYCEGLQKNFSFLIFFDNNDLQQAEEYNFFFADKIAPNKSDTSNSANQQTQETDRAAIYFSNSIDNCIDSFAQKTNQSNIVLNETLMTLNCTLYLLNYDENSELCQFFAGYNKFKNQLSEKLKYIICNDPELVFINQCRLFVRDVEENVVKLSRFNAFVQTQVNSSQFLSTGSNDMIPNLIEKYKKIEQMTNQIINFKDSLVENQKLFSSEYSKIGDILGVVKENHTSNVSKNTGSLLSKAIDIFVPFKKQHILVDINVTDDAVNRAYLEKIVQILTIVKKMMDQRERFLNQLKADLNKPLQLKKLSLITGDANRIDYIKNTVAEVTPITDNITANLSAQSKITDTLKAAINEYNSKDVVFENRLKQYNNELLVLSDCCSVYIGQMNDLKSVVDLEKKISITLDGILNSLDRTNLAKIEKDKIVAERNSSSEFKVPDRSKKPRN